MEKLVSEVTSSHTLSDQNLILGDFNFVHNNLDRVNESRIGMNQVDKLLSTSWVEMMGSLDISDPFRVRNPKRRMFSYIHTSHKAKSRIDRVYVNDENCQNIVNYRHTPTPFVKTHRILSFNIMPENERGPGYWKMNTSIIPDRTYGILIENIVNEISQLNLNDPIERWLVFIDAVRLETQIYCSKKKRVERTIKKIVKTG